MSSSQPTPTGSHAAASDPLPGADAPRSGAPAADTRAGALRGEHHRAGSDAPAAPAMDRHAVVAREKEQFGGMKLGTGFFGWLTATGMAVILLALLAAAGAITANATDTSAGDAAGQAAADPSGAGLVGGIVLLVVLLLSYYCGGYVAGRMARFNGLRQGVAVFLWAVVVTVVLAVVALVAGSQYDVLSQLNLPTLPSADDLTAGSIVTLLLVLVVTLGGAMLGGLAGMRFHRKVDRAGLGR